MLLTTVITQFKAFARDRQAIFWTLAFPLIFVTAFGLFDIGGDDVSVHTVAVVDYAGNDFSHGIVADLDALESFEVALRDDPAVARREIREGDLRYLMTIPADIAERVEAGRPAAVSFVFDETRSDAFAVLGQVQRFLDQQNLDLVDAPKPIVFAPEGVRTEHTDDWDYFNFLLPGLLAMGVMNFSIIGLATVLATYRERRIFKRILATPMPVSVFFTSMISSNLVLTLVQSGILLAAGVFLFDGSVRGSLAQFFLIILLGNLIFLSIGFITGAFARSAQAAAGMGNAVALPMMFLAGTFFPPTPCRRCSGPSSSSCRSRRCSPCSAASRSTHETSGSSLRAGSARRLDRGGRPDRVARLPLPLVGAPSGLPPLETFAVPDGVEQVEQGVPKPFPLWRPLRNGAGCVGTGASRRAPTGEATTRVAPTRMIRCRHRGLRKGLLWGKLKEGTRRQARRRGGEGRSCLFSQRREED